MDVNLNKGVSSPSVRRFQNETQRISRSSLNGSKTKGQSIYTYSNNLSKLISNSLGQESRTFLYRKESHLHYLMSHASFQKYTLLMNKEKIKNLRLKFNPSRT